MKQFSLKPVAAAVLLGLGLTSVAGAASNKPIQIDQGAPVTDAGGKRIAMDGTGNFVTVWGTPGIASGPAGVAFRRYNASGVAQGAGPSLASQTTVAGASPATARNAAGALVIVWRSGTNVVAQRIAADGTVTGGEIPVNVAAVSSTAQQPRVGIDSAGNFIVVWVGSGNNLLGRVFSASGTALTDAIIINDQTVDLANSSFGDVAADKDGNFAVTWLSAGQVRARQFNAVGTATGASVRVDLTPNGDPSFESDNLTIDYTLDHPVIAMDEAGDFAVAWHRDQTTTKRTKKHIPPKCYMSYGSRICNSAYDIYLYAAGTTSTIRVRRYNHTAGLSAAEIEVAKAAFKLTYNSNANDPTFTTEQDLGQPAIAMDQSGNFAVAWEKSLTTRKKHCYTSSGTTYCSNMDTTTAMIQARRYTSTSKPSGAAVTVANPSKSLKLNLAPSIAVSPKSGLALTWVAEDSNYTPSFWGQFYPPKAK